MSNQPVWKRVAQLGDKHPREYGGYWVFIDTTGFYAPKGEWLEVPDDETSPRQASRFDLDLCTFQDGVLSDNRFHPEHPAWFAAHIASIASTSGMTELALINLFCSQDPIERAEAYRALILNCGPFELDQYPLTLTAEEVESRYDQAPYEYAEVAEVA
jgi:hypothetical protein